MSNLLRKWANFGYQEQEIRTAIVFGTNADNVIIVLENDEVLAFGTNQNECLGTGIQGPVNTLKRIENLCDRRIEGFECTGCDGHFSIFAISASGSVFSWGANEYGQLGLCNSQYTKMPTKISGSLKGKKVVQVACSCYHTLALTSEGEVYAFGVNGLGQLGLGIPVDYCWHPRKVGGLLDGKIVTSVACQLHSSFALLQSGEVFSWGYNLDARLGFPPTSRHEYSPRKVIGLEGVAISQIVCGPYFTLALCDCGKIYSWGENREGELGNGTTDIIKSRPTIISTEMGKVREVAATYYRSHPCAAITENNQVYIWGSRINGQTVLKPMITTFPSLDEAFTFFHPVTYQRFQLKESKINTKDENYQKGPSIIERFQKEFDNPETADFAFIVEGKKIHVHKSLLTIGSGVFKNFFLGDWKDSSKKEQTVEDHSFDAFYAFLKYFYTDEVDFTPELALEVYPIAHFYLVTDLINECEKILKSGLTVQNVSGVYEKARWFGAKDLCEYCFEFCKKNWVGVMHNFQSDDSNNRDVFLEVFRWVTINGKKN